MSKGNLIDAISDRITFDKERLEKNELGRIDVESFNLSDFWTQFGAAVQALNNEVTKIGFACGKKPFPTDGEIDSMMPDLLQYYTVMRDLYLVLPPDVGTVLYKAVTSAMAAIMTSLLDFVKSLHCLTAKGAQERLTLTGQFWDACKAVDALPKDNLLATLQVIEGGVDLASDAQNELETIHLISPLLEYFKLLDERREPESSATSSGTSALPEGQLLQPVQKVEQMKVEEDPAANLLEGQPALDEPNRQRGDEPQRRRWRYRAKRKRIWFPDGTFARIDVRRLPPQWR